MTTALRDELTAKQQIHLLLKEKIGEQKYRIWFRDSVDFSLEQGCLDVSLSSGFAADWVKKHFTDQLKTAAEQITGESCRVKFRINENLGNKSQKSKPDISKSAAATKKKLKTESKNTKKLRMNLDNFVVGRSNELAYNAARAVAEQKDCPFNPLFIHGGYGVGKTHLMQGICNYVSFSRPNIKWCYLSAEDFANQFILALKSRKLNHFRNKLRNTDLLAIDDIHFLANKPSTQQEFLHTFNSIDLAGKQIVLVSDAHPKMIGQLSEKLVDRFVSGMVVKVSSPDYKIRCGICRQYAKTLKKNVPEKVIEFIAENIQTNARQLEGAMLKLSAFSSLNDSKITLSMTREILQGHLSRTDPIVHVSDIESITSEYFGTTIAKLHSPKKDKTVSLARHFSMYLARRYTNMSFPELGRCMGKNHATVIQGCRKVEDYLKNNTQINWKSLGANRCVRSQTLLKELEKTIAK
jgi:chromosomal replication initiator protein